MKQKRQNLADKSKRKDFGNVTADNNGQSSFGEVNAAVSHLAHLLDREQADVVLALKVADGFGRARFGWQIAAVRARILLAALAAVAIADIAAILSVVEIVWQRQVTKELRRVGGDRGNGSSSDR